MILELSRYVHFQSYMYAINLINFINQTYYTYTHCMYIYKRLLTDQFCITEDCLSKLHECPTKITFVKTICLSIFFGLFQALEISFLRDFMSHQS